MKEQLRKILGLSRNASDKAVLERAEFLTQAFVKQTAEDSETAEINRLIHAGAGSLTLTQAKSVRDGRLAFAAAHPRIGDRKLPLASRLNLNQDA